MPPESSARSADLVSTFLSGVERRVQIVEIARAVRAGLAVLGGTVLVALILGSRPVVAWSAALVPALATTAGIGWRSRSRWSPPAVGALVERALPESHNVVFTARELIVTPHGVAPWMRRRVIDAAAAVAARASATSIVPFGRDTAWTAAILAALVAVGLGVPQRITRAARAAVEQGSAPAPRGVPGALTIAATVTPPAYTGAAPTTVTNPERLEIIQGSRISLTLGVGGWQVRFGTRTLPPEDAAGRVVQLVPAESGYFAVERTGGGDRRLLPVTVTPDRAPVVRIEAPGKDLLMPAARGSVVASADATDDFGIRTLEILYTKVSGSGEQFSFVEGVLPVSVSRASGRAWKASGTFDLARLALEPGDSIVYHAVARDGRPGDAGAATSDTFFIEIAAPGQVALPGFELPPDRERYALSQQMVLLKLQRLRAKQPTLAREAVEQEAGTIAAEQRAVRANFIFLMGGTVEDEEKEAEQSNEIQEGRLENSARREINTAIKFMGEVEQALATVDTAAALPPAKSAVDALQRAFGHNRYFLKTLAVRSRIDPSRRLSGDLKDARDWRRLLEAPVSDPKVRQARVLLTRLLDLGAGEKGLAAAAPESVAVLAEEALAIDPGSADWQRISTALGALRDGIAAHRPDDELRRALGSAVGPLVKLSGGRATRGGDGADASGALMGAWADEARRR